MLIARRFCSARLFRAGQYQRGEFSSLSRGCVVTVTAKTIVPGVGGGEKVASRGAAAATTTATQKFKRLRGCGKIDRMETATDPVQTDRS